MPFVCYHIASVGMLRKRCFRKVHDKTSSQFYLGLVTMVHYKNYTKSASTFDIVAVHSEE